MNEFLTNKELETIIRMSDINSKEFRGISVDKGWFKCWDGTRLEGYIIIDDHDLYFMEQHLELVGTSIYGNNYKAAYNRLLPISTKSFKRLPQNGDITDLIGFIINNSTNDKYGWYKDIRGQFIPLTYKDIDYITIPFTEVEKAEYLAKKKKAKENLLENFRIGKLPNAENGLWYDADEYIYEIVDILRRRGFKVSVVGEKDSFGWLTRGIELNGKLMYLI